MNEKGPWGGGSFPAFGSLKRTLMTSENLMNFTYFVFTYKSGKSWNFYAIQRCNF